MTNEKNEQPANGSHLGWYMGGQATWFASVGIQFVLFPFIVTNLLDETPLRIGLAQLSLSGPAILFMLLGGATADRSDPRRILVRVHLLAAVAPFGLAYLMFSGGLTYNAMLVYGLVMGTASAFAMPARDTTLTLVARSNVQRAVTLAMAVQQTTQLAGMIAAVSAASLGAPVLFLVQGILFLIGAFAALRLPHKEMDPNEEHPSRARAIVDGLTHVLGSRTLLPVIVTMFAIGIFYIGVMLVILPLMVRDIYEGGVVELGLVNIAFWGGTIISTVTLLRFGHVVRRGRIVLTAITIGMLIVVTFSFDLPFWLRCLLCLFWGLGAGCTMTMARTIVQEESSEVFRARALAIFQLGFAGGAPLGAVLMGALANYLGPLQACLVPAGGMALVLLWVYTRTGLWQLRSHLPEAPEAA